MKRLEVTISHSFDGDDEVLLDSPVRLVVEDFGQGLRISRAGRPEDGGILIEHAYGRLLLVAWKPGSEEPVLGMDLDTGEFGPHEQFYAQYIGPSRDKEDGNG